MNEQTKIVRASIPSNAYSLAKAGAAMTGETIPDWLAKAVEAYFKKQVADLGSLSVARK